jgi:hypothetical protein
MNREREELCNKHIPRAIWRAICFYMAVEAGGLDRGSIPHPSVKANARRKLLKIMRLKVFQFGLELPFFRQVKEWQKGETLWVN